MIKRLAFYPTTKDVCAVARYATLLDRYSLDKLFVPKFMNLAGKDISCIDGGNQTTTQLSVFDNETSFAECDVLFLEYTDKYKDISIYNEALKVARAANKEIVFSKLLKETNQIFDENTITTGATNSTFEMPLNDVLYEIPVPVITVFSQNNFTDQFAVELALRKHFIDLGYKVSQIGSREFGKFFGFSNIPDFMYERWDSYEKILLFNHFIKDIIQKESPEIMIIGASGAIMKYNNNLLMGLGTLPYVIGNAVKADASILCITYGEYKNAFFDEVSQYTKYRLGCPTQFFGISNSRVTIDASTATLEHMRLNSDFVLKGIHNGIESTEYNLFNILWDESAKSACVAIQESLSGNVRNVKL